jgi:hypothetical protein
MLPDCNWDTVLNYYASSINWKKQRNLAGNALLAYSEYFTLIRCALFSFHGSSEEKEKMKTTYLSYIDIVDCDSEVTNLFNFDSVSVNEIFDKDGKISAICSKYFASRTPHQMLQAVINSLVLRIRFEKDESEVQSILENLTNENIRKIFQFEGISLIETYFHLMLRKKDSDFDLITTLAGHIFAEMCDKGSLAVIINGSLFHINQVIDVLWQSIADQASSDEVLESIISYLYIEYHSDSSASLSEDEKTVISKKIETEVLNNIQVSFGSMTEFMPAVIYTLKQVMIDFFNNYFNSIIVDGKNQDFLEIWPDILIYPLGIAYETLLETINK